MIDFSKYQGTGNDFVIIDNRNLRFPKHPQTVQKICDRRFGIGGDGLILLENSEDSDFKMVYYNADGNESSMCGNGGRCIVAFAHSLGLFETKTQFSAVDGLHDANISEGVVKLKMIDVQNISLDGDNYMLNTGSPHFVKYVDNLKDYKVFEEGNKIRNSSTYAKEGINVNFVEIIGENQLFVRTYERGVEDETFSCGTGVTAAALTYMTNNNLRDIRVKVLGGDLRVSADNNGDGFKNIWLEGPAVCVYQGQINF